MTKLTKRQESLLNELLEDFKGAPESILGQHGLMNELRKRVVEAMLDGELTSHLGYRAPWSGHGTGNSRNGVLREEGSEQRRRVGTGGSAGP